MVVIASDHPRLLKVSWRGEPLVAGLLGKKTRVVAMNRLELGCFFKQWTRCVLTCFDHLGWRFQAGICQSMRSLSAKGEATSSKYHGAPFFLHNHNESHRITMNHNESQQISGGFAAGLGRRKNWFYGKLWRAPAQQCHTQGLVVKSVAIWERTLKGQKNQRPTELLDMSY